MQSKSGGHGFLTIFDEGIGTYTTVTMPVAPLLRLHKYLLSVDGCLVLRQF